MQKRHPFTQQPYDSSEDDRAARIWWVMVILIIIGVVGFISSID